MDITREFIKEQLTLILTARQPENDFLKEAPEYIRLPAIIEDLSDIMHMAVSWIDKIHNSDDLISRANHQYQSWRSNPRRNKAPHAITHAFEFFDMLSENVQWLDLPRMIKDDSTTCHIAVEGAVPMISKMCGLLSGPHNGPYNVGSVSYYALTTHLYPQYRSKRLAQVLESFYEGDELKSPHQTWQMEDLALEQMELDELICLSSDLRCLLQATEVARRQRYRSVQGKDDDIIAEVGGCALGKISKFSKQRAAARAEQPLKHIAEVEGWIKGALVFSDVPALHQVYTDFCAAQRPVLPAATFAPVSERSVALTGAVVAPPAPPAPEQGK